MAIVYAENSEHGNAPSIFAWDSISGAPAINAASPIKGTYDIRVGRGGQNVDNFYLSGPVGFLGTTTVVHAHFWYKNATAPSAGNTERVLDISDQLGNYHRLLINDSRQIYWLGTWGTDGFQSVASRAEEIEVCGYLSGSRLYAILWVNGTLVQRYDIAAAGGTGIAQLIFGNLSAVASKFNYDAYYDDIVVDTASRIGCGLTLETEVPNADDGTEDEWLDQAAGASTYEDVDDIPVALGTYAWCVPGSSDATTQEQLWAFPATTATGTVIGVDCLFAAARIAGGSVSTFNHRIKLGATAVNTDLSTQMVTTPTLYRRCRATDPDSAAWTKTNADALLFGGQRGADANAYTVRIYDVWKTIVYRDTPKDWAGII